MSGLSEVSGSARSPVNFATKLVQTKFAILICEVHCTLARLLRLSLEEIPYEWIVHQSFITLAVNRAEVDLVGEVANTRRVYRHKRTHKFARVHRPQKISLHVFA